VVTVLVLKNATLDEAGPHTYAIAVMWI